MSVTKICESCLSQYAVYVSHRQANQRICPRCQAQRQTERGHAPNSIPLSRNRLLATMCRIESLPPAPWEARPPKTRQAGPYLRLEIRGSWLGYPWQGQITIFSPEVVSAGDVVYLRVMRTIHQNKKIQFGDRTAILPFATTEADIPGLIASQKLSAAAESYALVDNFQVREYLSLRPVSDGNAETTLTWLENSQVEGELWSATITGGEQSATLAALPIKEW